MIYYILLLISVYLYFIASYGVDNILIYISFIIYLYGTIDICRKEIRNKEYLTFNVVFLLSFFLVTYCTPMFVIGTDSEKGLIVANLVDFDYSTKATVLSTIAICCYFIGYTKYRKKKIKQKQDEILYVKYMFPFFRKLLILSTIALIFNVAWVIVRDGIDTIAITDNTYIMEFYKIFLIINLILNAKYINHGNSVREFVRINKNVIFSSLPITLFFLYLGDRGLPLIIIITFIIIYVLFYQKLRFSTVLIIGVIGLVSMFIIRSTRKSGDSLKNSNVSTFVSASQNAVVENSLLTMFADLYGASQELYLGYEYKEKHGLLYPEQIFIIPFMPIPFFPSILSTIMFGKTPYEMSPGMVLNNYASTATVTTHLGDHIVSNIYMRWGIIGIVFFFICFGKCVRYFFENRLLNVQYTACYIYLVSQALYLPRASILDILRPIVFIFIFVYISQRKERR